MILHGARGARYSQDQFYFALIRENKYPRNAFCSTRENKYPRKFLLF